MSRRTEKKELPISLQTNEKYLKFKWFLQCIRWKQYGFSYVGCLLLCLLLGYAIWKSGERAQFTSCEQYQSFSLKRMSRVKNLIFMSGFDCMKSLNMYGYVGVVNVTIQEKSFHSVRTFEIDGLKSLERLIIEDFSFTNAVTRSDVLKSNEVDGSLRIVNCPNLVSIRIGSFSFSDYSSLELSNLPSLTSLYVGQYSFFWTPQFLLTGLIE